MFWHLRNKFEFGLNGIYVRKVQQMLSNRDFVTEQKNVVGISHYFYSL